MDRDLALQLLDVMGDIKTAVETIANGGTPPEAASSPNVVGDGNRNVDEPEQEPENVTKATKTTAKRG